MAALKRPGVVGSSLVTAKPCPTCYAPMEKTGRGAWTCTGYGKHTVKS